MYMILPEEFVWDEGNREKNWVKHGVTTQECEEVFSQQSIQITDDPLHSTKECRYVALGKTKRGRWLFVIFIIRRNSIRIISARDQDKKERSQYGQETQKN
jgi:uncharacterized DUF497 family protein